MNALYLFIKIFPYFLVFEGSIEFSIIIIPAGAVSRCVIVHGICIILYKVSFKHCNRNSLICVIEVCPIYSLSRLLYLPIKDRDADSHKYSRPQ